MGICNKALIRLFNSIATSLYNDDFLKICTFVENKKYKQKLICENLITALRTAEDKRFFAHCGFDIIAILRSIFYIIFKNIKSGASTIDQQLIRTITQEKDKTIKRKIKEIILATAINNRFEKNDIANAYLNCAYYGWNMHGISEANSRISKENIEFNVNKNHIFISLLKYPLPRNPSEQSIKKIYNRALYIKNRIKNKQNRYI